MPTHLRCFSAAPQRVIDMGTMSSFVIVAVVVVLFTSGCSITSSKPPYAIQQYILEYHLAPLPDQPITRTLKIDRFAVSQTYNNTTMLRRPASYKIEPYNYHRWRTNPGDMVTDFLARDFKDTALFQAVLSYRHREEADYVLEGNVTEFLMTNEGGRWQVRLSLDASLFDVNKTAVNESVLFQKCYSTTEPIDKEDPVFFASGMSKAMAKVSAFIVKDVYQTIRRINTQSR
jgi:ABC-type uncharacterized transport system auxiliary subunit